LASTLNFEELPDGAVTFDSGHGYTVDAPTRGKPVVSLSRDGSLLHTERMDLYASDERAAFAASVNGSAAPGADVAAELLALGAVARERTAGEATNESAGRGPSQATRLTKLADELDIELFHAPDGTGYATYVVDGHAETWPIRSRGFKEWTARRFYLREGATPGSQATQDAIAVLSGRALFEGPEIAVALRVAEVAGTVYVDLGDSGWHVAAITAGGWQIRDRAPATVRFRRPRGLLALPEPIPGGTLDDLRPFLNVAGDDDALLTYAWLAQAVRGRGPYPVLALSALQGSAKSTTARALRSCIDPNAAPLRAEPRDVRDLHVAAANSWILAFDNISRIPVWLSDAACRLATGGGFSTRELYSDGEEVLFDAQRPLLFTGIEEFVTRADLLDRTILQYLPQLEERRREEEFWAAFEAAHPRIVGALFSLVSRALYEAEALRFQRLPRMADFAAFGAAVAKALGQSPRRFLSVYDRNQAETSALPLEASPIYDPLLQHLQGITSGEWTGTATELLSVLGEYADAGDEKRSRRKNWPVNSKMLSDALRRLAPNLRMAGVLVEWLREGHAGRRLIKLQLLEPEGESCVSSVSSVSDRRETAHFADAGAAAADAEQPRADAAAGPASAARMDFTPTEARADAADAADAGLQSRSKESCVTAGSAIGGIVRVTDAARLRDLLPELRRRPVLGFDCETTGLDPHRDRLRLVQLATPETVYVIDALHVDPRLLLPLFAGAEGPTLIGHNANFDLRFALAAGLPLPVGERLCDTMLLSQVLHAGLAEPKGTHTLAGVAERYLGRTLDKTPQHSDWSGPLSEAQIRYAAHDAAILLPLSEKLRAEARAAGLDRVAAIEMGALPALAWMTYSGAPFDLEAWLTLADTAMAEQLRLESELTDLAGSANLLGDSTVKWASPTQIRRLLERRGHRLDRTDEAALKAIAGREPLAEKLLLYREAARRAGAYGVEFRRFVHTSTGRIHSDFRQIGAQTGRASSSNPNVQNIPRRRDYRACFAPAPGRCLIKSDYSQIELRIAAQVSGDAALLAAFAEGADLHTSTAALVLGKPLDAVTKDDRQTAKAAAFGLLYGQGARGLQQYAANNYGVQLTEAEAARLRARFFQAYPGLRRWQEQVRRTAATETRTLAGRRRLGVERFTDRLNSPIQGSGADLIKIALARLVADRAAYPTALIVGTVHDEVLVEADRGEAAAVAAWLTSHMEAAGRELLADVPVTAEATLARDWAGTPLED